MLAPLPLLVDSAADWAGEAHAGLAVSTFWLAGNAGAAAVIYGFSQLADRALWNWAGLVLSALLISEALLAPLPRPDRKSVVAGKGVAGRVDLGGRRTIQKKKNNST